MREPGATAKSRDVRAEHKILIFLAFITKHHPFHPASTLPCRLFALPYHFFLIYSCLAERLYLPAK